MTMAEITPDELVAKQYHLLIDGEEREASSGKYFTTLNPARGAPLAEVAEGDQEDVDLAVRAARRALEEGPWATSNPSERSKILLKIADLIDSRADELALLESMNNGRPKTEIQIADLSLVVDCFEYFAALARTTGGDLITTESAFGNYHTYVRRERIGVCGAIIPWNFPMLMWAWKVAPALAMGNTVIVKPAEQTPITSLALGKLALDAGLPPGVVNVVPGFGPTAGAAIASHPGISKVALTGETTTGKVVMQAAAGTLKRVSFELGGKAPNIVFADADLEEAANGALFGAYWGGGEICTGGSRLVIEEPVYDEFVDLLRVKAEKIRQGDPLKPETQIGSLISAEQLDKVKRYVGIGLEEGAELVTGGGSPEGDETKDGYFFKPTIFANAQNSMRLCQEEIFGPVTAAIPFRDEGEALAIANDTAYGLAAAVWTSNIKRGHRVAHQIQSGTVWVNTYNLLHSGAPFGGYKQSGLGRELGKHALDAYSELKTVCVDLNDQPINWFQV